MDNASLALLLVNSGVRNNTDLEDLHAGTSPASATGDYSDVYVVDATGRKIPWNDVSRISDGEMKSLMQKAVNNVYTLLELADNAVFGFGKGNLLPHDWDQPFLHKEMARAIVCLGAFVPACDKLEQADDPRGHVEKCPACKKLFGMLIDI